VIPRHRPPQGLIGLFKTILLSPRDLSVEQVEDLCAEMCGVAHVVLLPSARAGICWALRVAVTPKTRVIGPAYTCGAVHEAMVRSGGQVWFVDVDPTTFLMDRASTIAAATSGGPHALVLSEIYGHSYDTGWNAISDSAIRIVDTAMTVPTSEIFARLKGSDFAVSSFGIGKCVYSGWGGAGLTRDRHVAEDVRRQRNAHVGEKALALAFRRTAEIALRTLAHSRWLYGALHRFRRPPDYFPTIPATWDADRFLAAEWVMPSTSLDRRLVARNLTSGPVLHARRQALAARYSRNLAETPGVVLPPVSPMALSHYTIRVAGSSRDAVRSSLLGHGIDTGQLFRLQGYLSPADFPNTAQISGEVINLPLDASLSKDTADYISESVHKFVSGRKTPGPASLSTDSDASLERRRRRVS
jgi:dTDP-4-amino-4,6-dideoxygalactose transaminase